MSCLVFSDGYQQFFFLSFFSFFFFLSFFFSLLSSHWCPALLAFVVQPEATVASAWPAAWTLPHVLAVLYLLAQLYFVGTMNEARGGTGPLPFSCSPMFAMPQCLTTNDMVNWLTDCEGGDMRSVGHLGTVEWSGPVFQSHMLRCEKKKKK